MNIGELAPGLADMKSSLETERLRAEIRDLTDKLDRTRRHLKAEKSYGRRLRRKLDRINEQEGNEKMNDTVTHAGRAGEGANEWA